MQVFATDDSVIAVVIAIVAGASTGNSAASKWMTVGPAVFAAIVNASTYDRVAPACAGSASATPPSSASVVSLTTSSVPVQSRTPRDAAYSPQYIGNALEPSPLASPCGSNAMRPHPAATVTHAR